MDEEATSAPHTNAATLLLSTHDLNAFQVDLAIRVSVSCSCFFRVMSCRVFFPVSIRVLVLCFIKIDTFFMQF